MPEILFIVLTLIGLSLFEIVTSIDNAVINADVLRTMSKWARRWFLVWGMFVAVFLVRGLLPFIIVFSLNPQMGVWGTLTAAFSEDPAVIEAVEKASPPLLMAGGVFLVFLFLHWLFLQPKYYGLRGEEFIEKKGVWFFAIVSVILTLLVWYSIQINPLMALGAAAGSSIFFVVHGFRENAEKKEREMLENKRMSDWSRILYLEVIDASFSIDGVLGAFAFTLSVPVILAGNGIGAIVVRRLTMSNIENVRKYRYLKNGAMYSVAFLGAIMIMDGFGAHIPPWISPLITISVIGYFFWKSKREISGAGE